MAKCSLPLHLCHVMRTEMLINRLYMFFCGPALLALFYYRTTTLFHAFKTWETPLLPHLLISISELVFTFLWVLHQAFRWRPVARTACPERLPEDEMLPPVDVFVCTADPSKEPPLGVMNTVVSAMALDYPPDKLAVYLSDDGGSSVTRRAIREAWKFSKWWLPFCRKYQLKTRCPQAYFSSIADDNCISSIELTADKKEIEKRYNEFKESLEKNSVDASSSVSSDHAPIIEVMNDAVDSNQEEMPILVYVAREKRPNYPHHFKAGAINTLIRVSAVLSNAPYILVLDCDHYCNDPTSARQAMCFYMDPEVSEKLAFVQFFQKFDNISEHDIYDGRLCYYLRRFYGFDGLQGPCIVGCNLYLKREALYRTKNIKNDIDLNHLKKSFGSSNELIKSIYKNYKPDLRKNRQITDALAKEFQLLASCSYDSQSLWGEEVGFLHSFVVEDAITSQMLHYHGWISVLVDPWRPCFLGKSPTNLSDTLVQRTRWGLGLMQISLSKYCGLIYGRGRMPTLQSMCYAALTSDPISVVPFYVMSIVPQICLVCGIPLYPKVSDPYFVVFAFIFVASQLKHVQEVMSQGNSIATALYELRIWMMLSASSYLYATVGAVMDRIGLHEADFALTNKVDDDEQVRRFQGGVYDFQASPMLVAPFCSLYVLNMASFIIGMAKIIEGQKGNELFVQAFIPLFGIVVNYHLLEGMVLRKDRGRISPYVSLVSVVSAAFVLVFGSAILLY